MQSSREVSIPRLPVDILADIVDQLSSNIDALKACSLVSRSWTYATRVRLFKSLSLFSLGDGDRFTCFLDFLSDTPDIGTFIRRLRLVSSPLHRRYSSAARVSPSLLVELLSSLPMLNTMEFCGVSFAGAQYDPAPRKTFRLDNVTFTDVGVPGGLDTALDWTSILSVFSSIGELRLHTELPHVHRLPPSLPASVLNASVVRLQDVTRPGILLEYLSATTRSEALTSVEVTLLLPEHIAAFGSFMCSQDARDSVQHVRLDFSKFRAAYYGGALDAMPTLSWAPFNLHMLHSLTLTMSLDSSTLISLAHLADMLTHTTSPHLRHLTIAVLGFFPQIKSHFLREFSRLDLQRIEDTVLEKMREVDEVVMDLSGALCLGTGTHTDDWEEATTVEEYVCGSMTRLWQKGVLRVRPPMSRYC